MNSTVQIIKDVVPISKHFKIQAKGRSKRAVHSLVGQLPKSLLCTATMDDVSILARYINQLTTRTNTLTNAVSQHTEHQSSFMSTVNKRISNVVKEVSKNHEELNLMHTTMQKELNLT